MSKQRARKWLNPDNIESMTEYPLIWVGWDYETIAYVIKYKDGSSQTVKIRNDDYQIKAIIDWKENLNKELDWLSKVYESHIRRIENVWELEDWEYLISKRVFKYHEVDWHKERLGFEDEYTAVNPDWLEWVRLALYNIIGRLVASSPYFGKCWEDWYLPDDLHNSLFIEADEIMCCTSYPRTRRVNKIYYLTHFTKENKNIKNAFKNDNTTYDWDICDKTQVTPPTPYWWLREFLSFWILNERQFFVADMLSKDYSKIFIATCLDEPVEVVDMEIENIRLKIQNFLLDWIIGVDEQENW